VWDYVVGVWRRLRGDSDGRAETLPSAKYEATPPTLIDGEKHGLTLTADGKLRVDDPTTQSKVDDVEAKLDDATYGLAALKALVAAIPTTPELEADALARYNALVAYVDEVESLLKNVTYGLSALKTAISGIPTTPELEADALTRYNTLVAYVDDLETRLTAARAGYLDNLSAGAAALEATLTAIKGAGWTTETLKAIRDAIATAQADLDNPAQYKADVSALALEATLTAIKGATWSNETLKAIYDLIGTRLAAANYVTERGTDNAALASVCTEARLANLDAAVSSRLAAASYVTERGTNGAALAAYYTQARAAYLDNLSAGAAALEATLTAIKGGGWTTQTLVAIKAAIDAITGGATAQQVWEYATRVLTSYHISSGATGNLLADGASITPSAGYRYYVMTTPNASTYKDVYIGAAWVWLGTCETRNEMSGYQKVTAEAGAWRLRNDTGAAKYYLYQWENVGASPVQPYKPTPGELVLEETPDWIITVPEKWLMEHKAEIEADVENKLGYDRHRDVLITMGFKMPKEKVK
jgi:hypothetical protein